MTGAQLVDHFLELHRQPKQRVDPEVPGIHDLANLHRYTKHLQFRVIGLDYFDLSVSRWDDQMVVDFEAIMLAEAVALNRRRRQDRANALVAEIGEQLSIEQSEKMRGRRV